MRPVTFDSLRAVGGVRSGCLCWGRSRRAVALPLEERESPQVQSVPSGARASRSGEEIPASARVVRSATPAAHRTRGAVALGPCGLWPPAGSPRGGFWQTAWGLPLELACPRKGVLSSQLALRACRLSRCVVLCDVGWSVGREREKLPCLALVWQGSSSSAAPMQHGPSSRGAVGRGRCVSDPPVMSCLCPRARSRLWG